MDRRAEQNESPAGGHGFRHQDVAGDEGTSLKAELPSPGRLRSPGAGLQRHSLLSLQRSAGNAAVAHMMAVTAAVQRPCGADGVGPTSWQGESGTGAAERTVSVQRQDPPSSPADAEGDPALVAQLESELDTVDGDAGQDSDLYLRAYASRVGLLLRFRAHPPFTTEAQLEDFIGRGHQLATTELDTLSALGAGAELALAVAPKGFPLTWSGRVRAALTLGIDPAAVLAESSAQFVSLSAQAETLPSGLADKGLPVPLAALASLPEEFPLRVFHQKLPGGNTVGDFARATGRYAQFRFLANFALTWERMVDDVAGAVADGSYVPRYPDYRDFVDNRQRILRDLPARARERLAMSDEELQALEQEATGLGDAALVTGMVSGLTGLLGVLSGWDQGARLFGQKLQLTDRTVAGAGDGERILMAFRWLWDAGYIGQGLGAGLNQLIASGPDILKSLAVIVVLQMIPGVNIAVDAYLMFQLGIDVLAQLTELGLAFQDVTGANSVTQMQRAAGRMATILTAGGLQILTVLVTFGVARGVSGLRARAARIRTVNPALSEEQALKQAMREATAAERAPLERASSEAKRGLGPWERNLSSDTRPILDTPGVREQLAQVTDRTRRVLTLCKSPCLPPAHQLLAADLQKLDGVLSRLGVDGSHPGLREYFYRRRLTLAQAIDDLDQGAPSAANLRSFLDRGIVAEAKLSAGATVARNSQGQWVYRKSTGSVAEITEYDIRAYKSHQREYHTDKFFDSHHGIQAQWAKQIGLPGYSSAEAPGILLRDSHAGSPHRIITTRQQGRAGGRGSRTYAEERVLMRQDLEAAGVPESFIQAAEQANDAYFARLYQKARSSMTPKALNKWFGTWVP